MELNFLSFIWGAFTAALVIYIGILIIDKRG